MREGFVWYAEGHIANSHPIPWTKEEDLLLARGYVEHDYIGEELHLYMKKSGSTRTPGAIDIRLTKLNFFMQKDPYIERSSPAAHSHRRKRLAAAERELANQIKLAKLEAANGVPLFKPKEGF